MSAHEPLQLIGRVDNRDDIIEHLQEENRQLKREAVEAKAETARVKKQNAVAISALRRQLEPLHRALQMVFGEIEAAGVEEVAHASPRVSAVWESWKSKLGEGPAKVIDALLLHGERNTQQLAIITGYHRTTIPAIIFKLNKAGLINKNGGKFSLKEP